MPEENVNAGQGEYDPTELIKICESITENGELSGDEIYYLSQWLNEHREACYHWPGNLLVKPLQIVWADGKLTKTEMKQIGRILVEIQTEWVRRQTDAALEPFRKYAQKIIPEIDLRKPKLPSIPITLSIRSFTEPDIYYPVDLSTPSCTCPDWKKRRKKLSQLHLSRCCKHILYAFNLIEPADGWPGWLGAFIKNAYPPKPDQDWMVINLNNRYVLISSACDGWASVFAKKGKTYERFGYNIDEGRWAYGEKPTNSRTIVKAIEDISRI